jgi:two-component system cell cycle sensor histidine kinase/response regulator CckA
MENLANIIGSAFPFHLVLDSNLKIFGSGKRLRELVPRVKPGCELLDSFNIERPRRSFEFEQIRSSVGELFILAAIDGDLRLRGQFYPYVDGTENLLLFLGQPWIIDLEDLQGQGLRLEDFPPHAGITDMLVLLQTQKSGLLESHRLTEKLRDTSNELKTRNLQLIEEIERRARTEEHMLQAQKMEAIGQLAGGVAHDLNNILLAINGHVSMALRLVTSPDKVIQNLDHVLVASKRATELTARLLTFGRKQVLTDVAVNIEQAFNEVEHILRPLLGERIQLSVDSSDSLGSILIDPSAFQQILINLVINARDALDTKGGMIRITGRSFNVSQMRTCLLGELDPGLWSRIQVVDNGIGIDPEIFERIFEPFFTTKKPGQGTGLGLSTVWWIIGRSGGALDVESTTDGGTVFSIYLRPTDEQAVEVLEASRSFDEPGRPGRILLVEDEDMVREPVTAMLQLLGWSVTEAVNAENALELASKSDEPFDMVLTDMVMPGLSGREFADQLRKQWPSLPIIFMTGYDPEGAGGFLNPKELVMSKPFDLEDLETFLIKARPSG